MGPPGSNRSGHRILAGGSEATSQRATGSRLSSAMPYAGSSWKTLAPRDPAGIIGIASGRGELAMTPDGRGYVFTYWKAIRSLFLAEGLPR